MLQIYIEGRSIDLPSDIAFDYSAENRLITQADGYSLGIDIPLVDSPVNSEVFGMIWRMDADIYSIRFNAQLITPQLQLSGVVMVVGVSESHVTIQFLEGRSQQNSELSFEESYINELTLGYTHLPASRRSVSADDARLLYGELCSDGQRADAVALPWVIKDSGEMVHNAVALKNNALEWEPQWYYANCPERMAHNPTQENLSYMPYLLTVAIRIAQAMGYRYEFAQWRNDPVKRNLLVCNTIPASLRLLDFSWVLPHWTVNEFFENIETILEGEFDIDHLTKTISFRTTASILSGIDPEVVRDVVDEFEVEVDIDDDLFKSETQLTKNIGYADNSSRFWPMQSCDWFIRRRAKEVTNYDSEAGTRADPGSGWADNTSYPDMIKDQTRFFRYDRLDDMVAELRRYKYSVTYKGYPYDALFYAADVRSYFILHSEDLVVVNSDFDDAHPGDREAYDLIGDKSYYLYNLMPVNDFGDFIVKDSDEADRVELKTVPVPVDMIGTDSHAVFLPYSADENLEDSSSIPIDPNDSSTWRQPAPYRELSSGDQSRHEYYDKLYLGYWTGGIDWRNQIPITSNVHVYSDFGVYVTKAKTMRLNHSFDRGISSLTSIDERKFYKISFLSDSLPNPRAEFLIRGKRYICKRLQISFSSAGMSSLIQGEFYRL